MGSKRTEIAVVGMACRFPGADGYDSFWENLIQGRNSISEIPPERWDLEQFYSPNFNDAGKTSSKWCGVVEGAYDFDHSFFNISPREAASMDPQQRLLLEDTWHCIEDSGISISELQQKVTAVYTGVMTAGYLQQMEASQADSYACLGNYESLLANRISYAFNLSGMSLPINAACASSLVAIHEARRALILGECDYALASAVNLNLDPLKYVSFSQSRMLSPTGQCKTFDQSADGYVPGDGVAVLLLQRLEEALEQGNTVYGIIKGSAVNHTGKSLSITAPRMEAQRDVILAAWRAADIDPRTITYIEAHGTGTSLGDPIEVEALTQAFRHHTPDRSFCKIGSVKTNIGHLESAAGIAGLVKVMMMLKHRKIPASLHVKTLNPMIPFSRTPLEVVRKQETWHSREQGQPLRAGISSFGFGGVNAHIVVEHYEPAPKPSVPSKVSFQQESREPSRLFLLSAKSEASLQEHVADWQQWFDRHSKTEDTLRAISLSLLKGREHFKYRFGGWAHTQEELRKLLNSDCYGSPQIGASAGYLNIQSPIWEGYTQLKCSGHTSQLLLGKVEKQIEAALKANGMREEWEDLMAGYYQDTWHEDRRELYCFIAGYVHAASLIQLGFAPRWIQGTGIGMLIAWVIGGHISVEDMISVLLKQKRAEDVRLCSPIWPVMQEGSSSPIMPFAFDDSYVHDLIQSVRIVEEQAYDGFRDELMDRAHRLYTHQYTFRNYINEWNDEWQESTGTTMPWPLQPTSDSSSTSESFRSTSAVLCIAVMDALRRVKRKWQLQVSEESDIPAVQELLDLLADQVITRRDIIEMLFNETGKHHELSRITAQLNQNSGLMLPERAYTLIRQHQQRTGGMHNAVQFLHDFLQPGIKNEKDRKIPLPHSEKATDWMKQAGQEAEEVTLELPFHENVLRLWLSGMELDMRQLAEEEPYQKVRLPRYAFQRKTFRWSANFGRKAKDSFQETESKKDHDRLHPMLHRNLSANQDIRFCSDFTGHEFFLNDHRVRGQRVLPGVAYLEMGRMALHSVNQAPSSSFAAFQIKNAAWTSPIFVDEHPIEVSVRLHYEDAERGILRYEISAEGNEPLDRLSCGTGRVALKSLDPVDRLDILSLIAAMREKSLLDHETIYGRLREQGLEYGPGHQAIERMYIGSGQALAHLNIPSHIEHTLGDYALHPSMMDGALQTAMLLLDDNATLQDQEKGTKLPFYMEELDCLFPCTAEMWVHVRFGDGGSMGGNVAKLDMDLMDAEGNVCVRIRNYMCRSMPGEKRQEHVMQDAERVTITRDLHEDFPPGTALLAPVWSVLPSEKDSRISCASLRTALIVAETVEMSGYLDEVRQQYPGASLILMKPGETVEQTAQELENCGQFDHLVWVSGLGSAEGKDASAITQSQEEGVIIVFSLVKSLLQLGYDRIPLQWTVVTFSAIAIHAQDKVHPLHASIHGFLGSLAKEYKNWTFRVVDLDFADRSLPSLSDMPIVPENTWSNLTVYRAKQWHRCELLPVKLPSIQQSAYRRCGVYVVIGGAGGLGKVWSEYMISRYNAQIIWIGRTPLNPDIAKEQERLALTGPAPEYISADAGSPEALHEAYRLIKQRHGTIHGVIHAAIALRDSSVMKMDLPQFNEGLYAKVNVCAGMLEVFEKEPLDFMLFFSSINAFATPAGQSNYTAGCTFKDSFAQWLHRRLHYPVKTINWGYWGSTGTVASPAYRERMTKQGIGSIEPPEAMAALELLLASSLPQLGLVKIIGEAKPYAISEQEFMTVYH
ncbi:SDR family NAD(P)-dependent oxidoreductase [Paenibacillus sp. QZ-Y1]|uniref:SDR family NAD(P)-dependent oxidoreductase n=1 Tax=Paenibacillus sp. QZ-Y1 TaxID=3414511 RepID=UPI003F79749D